MTLKAAAILLLHAVIGWALCGATMGLGLAFASESTALLAHLSAALLFFIALSWSYHRWFAYTRPLLTAACFTVVIIVLDVVVVAALIQGSFAMFASVLGTWLPFSLIFAASWLTGLRTRERAA